MDYQVEDRTEDCLEHSPSQLPQQQHHQHTRYTWLHPLDFQRNLQESTRTKKNKKKIPHIIRFCSAGLLVPSIFVLQNYVLRFLDARVSIFSVHQINGVYMFIPFIIEGHIGFVAIKSKIIILFSFQPNIHHIHKIKFQVIRKEQKIKKKWSKTIGGI